MFNKILSLVNVAKSIQKKHSAFKKQHFPRSPFHYKCADLRWISEKDIKRSDFALKSNIVPGPRLHYKCADCEEALGHGNPDIFGPPCDCGMCGGIGCSRCS